MKKLAFITLLCLAAIACENDTRTVAVGTVPQQIASPPPFSPTPGPTPLVQGTAMQCGNANYGMADLNDPDDAAGQGDAMICIWSCTNLMDINHLNPPYEIREEWDFDPPTPAYIEFGPYFYPCYTYHP